ncbi:MAG TPA: CopD family protein [Pseudonocardiaceae bacterium]|nr:CopD family protein [Pseudonocardiaceae bacterium]
MKTALLALAPIGGTAVGVLYWTSRVVSYASFALLVGAVGFVLLCWPEGSAQRRVVVLIWVAWPVLLLATVADTLLQGPYGAKVGLTHLFDTDLLAATMDQSIGVALALRVSLLAVAVPLLSEMMATRRRVVLGWLCAVVGIGLAVTWSMAGHVTGVGLPVDALHVAASGLWLGGLVVLWHAKPPPSAVLRFSRIAFACVGVLVVTGTYQSWQQLGSWAAFLTTGYGKLLLLKIGGVALVLGGVWLARRWVRSQTSAPRYASVVQATGAVVVLALTATLVTAQPPRQVTVSTPDCCVIPFATGGPGGAGKLKVDTGPLATGPDVVTVVVSNRAGRHMNVAELDMAFTMPSRHIGPLRVTMHRAIGTGPGNYRARIADLPLSGSWQLAFTVRTSEIDETTVAELVDVSAATR